MSLTFPFEISYLNAAPSDPLTPTQSSVWVREIGISSGANLCVATDADDVRERPDLSGVKQRQRGGGGMDVETHRNNWLGWAQSNDRNSMF